MRKNIPAILLVLSLASLGLGGAWGAPPSAPADVSVPCPAVTQSPPLAGTAIQTACTVSLPESYAAAYRQKLSNAPVAGLYGRVIRGVLPKDFEMLGDPSRKIIFFMNSSGLQNLLGHTGREALEEIGYPETSIDDLLARKNRFKLVVFNSSGVDLRPATWENVVSLVQSAYPESKYPTLARKISVFLPELTATSFDAISKSEGRNARSFFEVDRKGPSDPDFLTAEKFEKIDKPTLRQVRAFLYYQLRLNELFRGDGFTQGENGKKLAPEFIGLNRKLDGIPGAAVIDLSVENPPK